MPLRSSINKPVFKKKARTVAESERFLPCNSFSTQHLWRIDPLGNFAETAQSCKFRQEVPRKERTKNKSVTSKLLFL